MRDTICAIATGATNSGISIIRISGEEAIDIADRIFVAKKAGRKLTEQKTHTLCYGTIMYENEIIDEVLVSVMRAPNSYTAENVVEINCHGGMFVTRKILEVVLKSGARLAEPGEFTKRAFLNGRIDLSQAEAVIDVINASNNDAVRNSVNQLSGKLRDKIKYLREMILKDTAFIEAVLDDPEHISLDGFTDKLEKNVFFEIEQIEKLISSYENGRIIKDGIRTVILGKPNAGKSTLLNTLSGTERAIVTDIPGTTRDTIEETVTIKGITLCIIDTAGIRETNDLVEKIGVDKALSETDTADLILFVADASSKLDENDEKILELIKNRTAIILLNKSDITNIISVEEMKMKTSLPVLLISAKQQTGIDEFADKVYEMFSLGNIGKSEEIYITSMRHKEKLEEADTYLKEVLNSIENDMPEDFYSIDLLGSYKSLGEILGEEIEDDLADKIFSEFCMGK